MSRRLIIAILLVAAGCQRQPAPTAWLGPVSRVDAPATGDSRYPNLANTPGEAPVMSWLQRDPAGAYALRHASWTGQGWTAPVTVAEGSDWFINWADFPSVVPISRTLWAAHWLQQKPGNVYSYDVRMSVSRDRGVTWSAPLSPHDDGTPTEHGFVSIFADERANVRAVWLDGRHTSGEHEHGNHEVEANGGAMMLRGAVIDDRGQLVGQDVEIDAGVCDCCQTDAALTDRGPVVVYRDRTTDETRDIHLVRLDAQGWSPPVRVHADGWRIDACPVNGPAVDASGAIVVVAWFTAADIPRVRVAFSDDAGRRFAAAIEVASGRVAGRVDVVLLPDGRAVVSWLAEGASGAEIRAQPFTPRGAAGEALTIASTSVARSSGFPRMALTADQLLFAWTDATDPPQIKTAIAHLN